MLATLILYSLLATNANAAGLLGAVAPGSMFMQPRAGLRLPNGDIDGLALVQALNDTLARYNSAPITRPYDASAEEELQAEAASQNSHFDAANFGGKRDYNENLTNNQDIDYDGYVTVGTKIPTKFFLQFDTGSPNIIVPGLKCAPTNGCPHTARYPALGTPLDTQVNLTYSGGTATGFDWNDTVTVAGLTVSSQTILSLTAANISSNPDYDGVFGMSFSAAASDNSTTFFENLIAEKSVSAPEFSFFLGRVYNSTDALSQLTLGGRNTSQYTGPLTSVPVVAETQWILEMDGITVNSVSAGSTIKGQVSIDTGTSFVVVPLPVLSSIFSLIPGSLEIPLTALGTSAQFYAYPCNTSAAYIPSFTMAGKSFPIAQQDFSLGYLTDSFLSALAQKSGASEAEIQAKDLCVAGMFGLTDNVNPNLYVLGDVFLKGWYSVFGYGEDWPANKTGATVGFAQVVQDAPPPKASHGGGGGGPISY